MTRTRLIASMAITLLLLPQTAGGNEAVAPRHSANLTLVAQIPGAGGTDLEFFSRTLETYFDRDGNLVEPSEPVERHFAFVGNQQSPAKIVDITSPEQPFVASQMTNCTVGQGDIQVTADGMVGAIAKQGSGTCRTVSGATLSNGSALVDLSDVYNPMVIGRAVESQGSHNHTIHPGGKFLYISPSALAPTNNNTESRVPIFDISNPAAPVKVKDFMIPVNGPHDIRFNPSGTRAYFAGVSAYHIVNTSDPKNPSIISTIVPPGGSIGHDTLVTPDGAFLFLGDEGGGGAPYPCPGGAIYAYDIRDETRPILLGLAEAGGGPVTNRNLEEATAGGVNGCTSHVMELNPDKKSLTLGWYGLGSRMFSFSSFYNADGTPKAAGNIAAAWGKYGVGLVETGYMIPDGGNTWSAKQYAKVPGYIFSDDLAYGFYVTKITG